MEEPKWKEYAVHDDKFIKGFFGVYRFLSNFEITPVMYEGWLYPSSENAYQSAKTLDRTARVPLIKAKPNEAKKLGQELVMRHDWHLVKVPIMRDIVANKFDCNPDLFGQLLETGSRYLEETNHWKDEYWGVNKDTRVGHNELGRILMNLRDRRTGNRTVL